jgi:hypothetical protein
MSENDSTETPEVVDTAPADTYVENPDFVPDVTDAMGTLDTSGTAGGAHEDINQVTPVFEAAKAQDLQRAALAVDPEHPEVPESEVTLSTGTTVVHGDPEEDRERVQKAAEAYQEDPVEVKDPSLTSAEKNQESGVSTDPVAVAEQQKATSGTGDLKAETDREAPKKSTAKKAQGK